MSVAYHCYSCGSKIEWDGESTKSDCPNCGSGNWWPARSKDTDAPSSRLAALEAKVEKLLKAQDDRVGRFSERPSIGDPSSWPKWPSPYGYSPVEAIYRGAEYVGPVLPGESAIAAYRRLMLKGAELPPKRHERSGYAPPSFNPIKWWGIDKPGYSPEWVAFDEAATISNKVRRTLKTAVPGGVTWVDMANDALKEAIDRNQPNWSFAAGDTFTVTSLFKPKKKRVAKGRRK